MDLIVYFSVQPAVLSTRGRAFAWPRLPCCPRCGFTRLWGHGYVRRYFDGIPDAVWVKRWRCPACRAVHTMRPCSHWRGFWAAKAVILESLQGKLAGRSWPARLSRQRQQYWWRGFVQQAVRGRLQSPGARVFQQLIRQRRILATHSLKYFEVCPLEHPPHRIFAVTPALEAG